MAVPTVERLDRLAFLLGHGDGRRNAVDPLGLGLFQPLEELPRVGRKALDVAALSLGVERVEGQAALAAAAEAAEHDQLPMRDVQVDRLQVVDPNAPQRDVAEAAPLSFWEMGVRAVFPCSPLPLGEGPGVRAVVEPMASAAPLSSQRSPADYFDNNPNLHYTTSGPGDKAAQENRRPDRPSRITLPS